MSNLLMFFSFYLLLPILPLYLEDQFHAGKSVIGVILASYTITALLIRPMGGCWVDRYPRKVFLLLVYIGFVAFFGGYLLAGSLLVFGLLRAVHGVAFGMVTISNSTMAIDVIPLSRRSEGIGYFALSSNIAMALGPVVAMYVFDRYHDHNTVFAISLVAGILGIVCVSRIRGGKTKPHNPVPLRLKNMFLFRAWPCSIVLALIAFGYGIIITYVAVYGKEEVGLSSGSGLFFLVMALGLVLSRLLSAPLMNKKKLVLSATIGMGLMIVGYLLFILGKNQTGFYLSGVLLGISYGFSCPAFQVMFIDMSEPEQRGVANSTFFTSWDLGIGLGVLIGGQVAAVSSYSLSYACALFLVFTAIVVFRLFAAPYFLKHKLDHKV